MELAQLGVVSSILRRHPSAGALHHVGPIISSFLGPPGRLTFHRTCAFESIALLDWIWSISCTSVASRSSEWSLANFLRSDPHYHHWEFSMSMEMAASRGDLELIKWLFTHFSDCKVLAGAVEAAASKGDLAVLQYLLDHDTNNQENARLNVKKRKVITESGELVSVGNSLAPAKATHVVCWETTGFYTGLVQMAIDNGHIDAARWLYENILNERGERKIRAAVKAAQNRNDMELAKSFVPPGQDVTKYANFHTGNIQVVEHMIDSGHLQRSGCFGVMAIKNLVDSGRLDVMQRVASLRFTPRKNNREWTMGWREILKSVCYRGDCEMLQWALEHRMGRRACTMLRREDELFQLLWNAVAGGSGVAILQSLKASGSVDKYGPALVEAVAKNDMNSIEWLLANFPQSEHISAYCVLDEAAKRGHLNILKYFQSLPSAPGFVPTTSKVQKVDKDGVSLWSSSGTVMNTATRDAYRNVLDNRHGRRSSWNSTDAMDDAAANGHLETVQWLHANRTEGCTTDAMDFAAANGHLDVLKWLQANRSVGPTTKAMDGAASNGHLHVVQWLHEHTSAGCTSNAMDLAAEHGHLPVLKWLYANRTEGCTLAAVEKSLRDGHLAVASWLKRTFPQLKPQNVDLSFREKVSFAVVLFVQEHYGDLFTQERFWEWYSDGTPSEDYLMNWMQENDLEDCRSLSGRFVWPGT